MRKKLLTLLAILLLGLYVVFEEAPASRDPEAPEQQQLEFWGVYDLKEVYEPAIQSFKRRHPEVDIVYKQFPNFQEYHQLLLRQLEQGSGPDIFLVRSDLFDFYDGFINPSNPSAADGFPDFVQQDLIQDSLLYGLPLWSDTLVLYYNKNYYPDGIPSDWESFGERTQDIRISGVAMGEFSTLLSAWDIVKALFLQYGVQDPSKNSEQLRLALQSYLRFAYPIDPFYNWSDRLLRPSYTDLERDSFMQERVAAIAGYGSLWDLFVAKDLQLSDQNRAHLSLEKIGVASFPQLNPDKPVYLGNYAFLTVGQRSAAPQLAWEFIRELSSEEHQAYYHQATGRLPGRSISSSFQHPRFEVMNQQLPHVRNLWISDPRKQEIEAAVETALKDRSLLDLELPNSNE